MFKTRLSCLSPRALFNISDMSEAKVRNIVSEGGHLLGNFHAYYSFNPAKERMRFMNENLRAAFRNALLSVGSENDNKNKTKPFAAATVLDVGCNEVDLTIGLFHALLNQKVEKKEEDEEEEDEEDEERDSIHFDAASISKLNEIAQKQKHQIDYLLSKKQNTNSDQNHRQLFVCELSIDAKSVAKAEGVSKKVAKAKAASVALRRLRSEQNFSQQLPPSSKDSQPIETNKSPTHKKQKLTETTAAPTGRKANTTDKTQSNDAQRPLFVLGVDVDAELIKRAAEKATKVIETAEKPNKLRFSHANVMEKDAFDAIINDFFSDFNSSNGKPSKFDLITCFSVTMWIHLNHGDEGLFQFLSRLSEMAEHLIIEPQPWKCYRNAQKRLERLGVTVPSSFLALEIKENVLDKIETFLCCEERFPFKCKLGKTNWSRPVTLYSRTKIPSIDYEEES